jgi:hypothetical protein
VAAFRPVSLALKAATLVGYGTALVFVLIGVVMIIGGVRLAPGAVVPLGFTGAVFILMGVAGFGITRYVSRQVGAVADGAFGLMAGLDDGQGASPSARAEPTPEKVRAFLADLGITIPPDATITTDHLGVISVDARARHEGAQPAAQVAPQHHPQPQPAGAAQPAPALETFEPVVTAPGLSPTPVPFPAQASAEASIRATGVAAKATIRELRRTGVITGDEELVELALTVVLEGRDPYHATAYGKAPQAALAQLGPGTIVPVKVSQHDLHAVALDWKFA